MRTFVAVAVLPIVLSTCDAAVPYVSPCCSASKTRLTDGFFSWGCTHSRAITVMFKDLSESYELQDGILVFPYGAKERPRGDDSRIRLVHRPCCDPRAQHLHEAEVTCESHQGAHSKLKLAHRVLFQYHLIDSLVLHTPLYAVKDTSLHKLWNGFTGSINLEAARRNQEQKMTRSLVPTNRSSASSST
jgi:hypothetical protein